ncbi:hypothetical protein HS088_TW18G01067 [Tripterygium wilfordii]|uniref:Uncharacterized protein n=1 Tax=Tripterygium wilfordii TaxID=458696 RepID=A0A7J7CE16_TRIWF|nr:hypothetical protein HS088_TW18G01067 [Tripterygium wilfordii]
MDTKRLCALASAADSLKLRPLVNLTSRALAHVTEGKTPEIHETFHLPGDLTEELDACSSPGHNDEVSHMILKSQDSSALPSSPQLELDNGDDDDLDPAMKEELDRFDDHF